MSTLVRKIRNRNLETGNGTLSGEDVANFWLGDLTKVVFINEAGKQIDEYYGYGLQKLMQSARFSKDKNYVLVTRHFASNKDLTPFVDTFSKLFPK